MLGFVDHADQLGDFVVDGGAAGAVENANAAFREVFFQFVQNGDRGVVLVVNTKNQLVVRVVLAAVTGEIFVGFGVQAADGLEVADGRCEIRVWREAIAGIPKKTDGAIESQKIVNERSGRQNEK